MAKAAIAGKRKEPLSHNLLGQRLGRKGRDTRARILAAACRLLAQPDASITLSSVAREASLAMTTLYLYFSDLPELLGAVLEPVMETAEEAYLGQLRTFWPDAELGERCRTFVTAYFGFWMRNTRILHLRNAYADNGDARMRLIRVSAATPVLHLMMMQMRGEPSDMDGPAARTGTVLITGLERVVTVSTDTSFRALLADAGSSHPYDSREYVDGLLKAQARVLELAIADRRADA
jgi:AcrR family transcriptional regulator